MGLTLVLDYNEERQINLKNVMTKNESTETKAFYNDDGESASIYLDTISMKFVFSFFKDIMLLYRSRKTFG